MRWALHLLAAALVVAAAFWSYRVSYRTQALFDEIARVNRAIGAEREAIQVASVEWAWLNAPDRLARLAEAHAEALGLAPIEPERLGELAEAPLIEPDDGLDPVALMDLDALYPEAARGGARSAPAAGGGRAKPAEPAKPVVTAEAREPAPHRAAPPVAAAAPPPPPVAAVAVAAPVIAPVAHRGATPARIGGADR